MANLYSGIIKSNGDYKDLSVESGIAFEVGKDYQIQFSNKGYIRDNGDVCDQYGCSIGNVGSMDKKAAAAKFFFSK